MPGAKAAVPAYEGFVVVLVPEYRAEDAGPGARPAAAAPLGFEYDPAAFALHKGVLRTGAGARRVSAGAADRQEKAVLHAAGRPDTYAALGQACVPVYARAGKHAALAAHAFIGVDDLESHQPSHLCASFYFRITQYRMQRKPHKAAAKRGVGRVEITAPI
jgi:hypothetical protein